MPSRKLPATDESRLKALQSAATKVNNTTATKLAFPGKLAEKLAAFLPKFEKEVKERGSALKAQAASTEAEQQAEDRAAMYISHFIQVFNLCIQRGQFQNEERAYFQLDINQETVPRLTTEADVLYWGQRLIEGEALRTSQKHNPMSNPAIGDVELAYNEFIDMRGLQTKKIEDYYKEQNDVAGLRPEADELVKDIWDEVEHTFRKLDPPSKRRRAREYGVVYVTLPGETPDEVQEPASQGAQEPPGNEAGNDISQDAGSDSSGT